MYRKKYETKIYFENFNKYFLTSFFDQKTTNLSVEVLKFSDRIQPKLLYQMAFFKSKFINKHFWDPDCKKKEDF